MTSSPPGMPDEDYEAIEAAVMETARGRWFLMEFARRNRNADTRVLLEAIARLEEQVTGSRSAPTTPHQPISTTVVSSASSQLFAMERPLPETAVTLALPEPPELAWVDEEKIDMDRPIQPDIFHLDDDLIVPTADTKTAAAPALPRANEAPKSGLPDPGKFERVPATADLGLPAPPRSQLAAPKPAEPSQPAQSRMLAGALAQAEEALARTNEPAPPPPPSAFSPAPADPVELDALSFEEKSVYFG